VNYIPTFSFHFCYIFFVTLFFNSKSPYVTNSMAHETESWKKWQSLSRWTFFPLFMEPKGPFQCSERPVSMPYF